MSQLSEIEILNTNYQASFYQRPNTIVYKLNKLTMDKGNFSFRHRPTFSFSLFENLNKLKRQRIQTEKQFKTFQIVRETHKYQGERQTASRQFDLQLNQLKTSNLSTYRFRYLRSDAFGGVYLSGLSIPKEMFPCRDFPHPLTSGSFESGSHNGQIFTDTAKSF